MNNVLNMDQTPAQDTVVIDQAPNNPAINGPTSGKIRTPQTYTFFAGDPDNDPVFFWIDWGDGTNSGWLGPFPPGSPNTASHTWTKRGSYTIQIKAKDSYAVESGTTSLPISMPMGVSYQGGVGGWLLRHPFLAFLLTLCEDAFTWLTEGHTRPSS
jgi:hypothetical protein